MTYEALYELPFVPKMLGSVMYPGGFPVKPENISFNDHTVQEWFLKHCEAVTKRVPPDLDGEELLRQYVLYYIHAPIWQAGPDGGEFIREELLDRGDLEEMGLDKLIDYCMNYGLDPF